MKERPILFSAPMVRAILAGTKTQTRRVVKPESGLLVYLQEDYGCRYSASYTPGVAPVVNVTPGRPHTEIVLPHCPYGQPGDRLWVRESFSGVHDYDSGHDGRPWPPSAWFQDDPIWYWADGNPEHGDWTRPRPSIHMPRWASRILLDVTDVRVQRLQDISEGDARAEGVTPLAGPDDLPGVWTGAFERLWDSINGAGAWLSNPWVWAVSFRRVHA